MQKYWSGLYFTPPSDLLDPGIEPASLASPALDSLLLHFLTFLVLQGASGSYCIFPATVFKSAIYLMSTGFFFLKRRVFKTKIWLLGVNSLF